MNYAELSKELLPLIGGEKNVNGLTHCVTRLRFNLADSTKAKTDEIKKLDGVLGVMEKGGQYQVVIGNNVKIAFEEVEKLLNGKDTVTEQKNVIKEKFTISRSLNAFLRTISSTVFPIIPVMAAAGIIKGIMILLQVQGIISATDGAYYILYTIGDGLFYFLPVMVGFTAAKVFNMNQIVGAAIGGALIYPDILNLVSAGTSIDFFGIPVVLNNYSYSLFPVLASVFLASHIEKFFKKIVPAVVDFLVPAAVMLITIPLAFLIVGPIMTGLSNGIATGMTTIYSLSPLVCAILMGALWQLIVITGLHHAFVPIFINALAVGPDPIQAMTGPALFGLVGAAVGFAIKMKDKKQKALGFSTFASGVFGVTEPIIFAIAIPYKKPFIAASIGGAIGGIFIYLFGDKNFSLASGGILAFTGHIDPSGNVMPLIGFFVAAAVSFICGMLACIFLMDGTEKIQ